MEIELGRLDRIRDILSKSILFVKFDEGARTAHRTRSLRQKAARRHSGALNARFRGA
ncbi:MULTISPECIES: hypothetical protein [Burkholderia]|uniref:hypothetical protein n=1 Tax=Burkholderia TaxID=32008 RepID=UPI001374C449|nr:MULTISPECIES: hypothetical protein [Burkholderia]